MTTSVTWQGADAYEAYMGRWSRQLAELFVSWFAAPPAGRWLDIGCGTGALSAAVLAAANPDAVVGIDPSPDFVATANAHCSDRRVRFEVGDARALDASNCSFDVVVAGLVLNHIPDANPAVAEMMRVARGGGLSGGYVWDYRGEMQLMRYFWEAVAATDANASDHDPRAHYSICLPEPLAELFRHAGLRDVTVSAIDLPMMFVDFDDFWIPHTFAGPAPVQRYVATLDDDRRNVLRDKLRGTLPIESDGTIRLIGRAWAVRGMTVEE